MLLTCKKLISVLTEQNFFCIMKITGKPVSVRRRIPFVDSMHNGNGHRSSSYN